MTTTEQAIPANPAAGQPVRRGLLGRVRGAVRSSELALTGIAAVVGAGAGVGIRFLGHIERTAILVHLLDGTQEDVVGAWRTIRHELEAYGAGIEDKAELLALNKADALTPEARAEKAAELEAAAGKAPFIVSGVSGEGVVPLLRAAFAEVRARRAIERREQTTGETPEEDWRP